jgi:hypothetical protein
MFARRFRPLSKVASKAMERNEQALADTTHRLVQEHARRGTRAHTSHQRRRELKHLHRLQTAKAADFGMKKGD